jgi:hypothetical protein
VVNFVMIEVGLVFEVGTLVDVGVLSVDKAF